MTKDRGRSRKEEEGLGIGTEQTSPPGLQPSSFGLHPSSRRPNPFLGYRRTHRPTRPSEEIHHRVALLIAVAALEVDGDVAVGADLDRPRAPEIRRAGRRGPRAQLVPTLGCERTRAPTAKRWLSSKTTAPSTQAISMSRRFRFNEPDLLADGNVLDGAADQGLAAGRRRRRRMPSVSGEKTMLSGLSTRSAMRCSGS